VNQVLAIPIGVAILMISRAVVVRRYRADRLTARRAGVAMGFAWALLPVIFEATSGRPAFDWIAIAIASPALFVSVCLTTIWFLEHLQPRAKPRSARTGRPA
jgi:Kef-type K+ transport system membrane component KefB